MQHILHFSSLVFVLSLLASGVAYNQIQPRVFTTWNCALDKNKTEFQLLVWVYIVVLHYSWKESYLFFLKSTMEILALHSRKKLPWCHWPFVCLLMLLTDIFSLILKVLLFQLLLLLPQHLFFFLFFLLLLLFTSSLFIFFFILFTTSNDLMQARQTNLQF